MEEDDDFTIECTQEEVEALTEKLLDNDDNNCSKFFRYSEGGFLKKVFGENLTAVLMRTATFHCGSPRELQQMQVLWRTAIHTDKFLFYGTPYIFG